jgi:hypothetical protein
MCEQRQKRDRGTEDDDGRRERQIAAILAEIAIRAAGEPRK